MPPIDETSDAQLIEAIRSGDEDAFSALFDRYLDTLTRYARRWLPPKVQRKVSASDIVQEAHITALARMDDFEHRGEGSLRNWLLKIVEFKVREAVRAHAHTAARAVAREVTKAERADTVQFAGHQDTPSQVAVATELEAFAAAAMRKLPENYQQVLHMARREMLSMREIADRLGKSREAVKKIHARALARFSAEFAMLRRGEDG